MKQFDKQVYRRSLDMETEDVLSVIALICAIVSIILALI